MGTNIKTLQDALFVLDSMIRKEANLAGVLTNAQASQIGLIQSMLIKFPLRNCDRFAPRTTDEVKAIIDEWRAAARVSELDSLYAFARWLLAPAAQEGDGNGNK